MVFIVFLTINNNY